MSEEWADRERRTNKLVRIAARWCFEQKTVSPDQLYGLCRLTWITNRYELENPAYIRSTKIPALEDIFASDFAGHELEEIARKVSVVARSKSIRQLIQADTGFTNLYTAYRASARKWCHRHHSRLLPLFQAAYRLRTHRQGLLLVEGITKLPGIPKGGLGTGSMNPAHLLMPVFFALDPRVRFPILNGNAWVKTLLRKLNVSGSALEDQYEAVVRLYGKVQGIKDAADIDHWSESLADLVGPPGKESTKAILTTEVLQRSGLKLKDEADVTSVQKAKTRSQRRVHNQTTNRLLELKDRKLFEGRTKRALYDVLIPNYDGERNDLMIEVKSALDAGQLRMAIGQLYHYWFAVNGSRREPHLAILLPSCPTQETKQLLAWREIGLLWFARGQLYTSSPRLASLAHFDD